MQINNPDQQEWRFALNVTTVAEINDERFLAQPSGPSSNFLPPEIPDKKRAVDYAKMLRIMAPD